MRQSCRFILAAARITLAAARVHNLSWLILPHSRCGENVLLWRKWTRVDFPAQEQYELGVAILALHKALSDRPRDPLAVAAFSLAVHNGGKLSEAVTIAGMINKPHDVRFPELLDPSGLDAETLEAEILDLAESVKGALLQITNEYFVSQAMADYPEAPKSNLVFIPLSLFLKASSIFDCIRVSTDQKCFLKQGRKIDYESLALGNMQEIRHVFARVVFDTIYPLHQNQDQSLNS